MTWPKPSRTGETVIGEIDQSSVLRPTNRLEVLDPFAPSQSFDDRTFFVVDGPGE